MARVGELHIFLFVIHLTGPSPNFLAMMFAHIMIYVNQSTMDVSMYDAQADSINVDDIAKNSNNRIVLRQLQRNEASNMYRNHYTSLYIRENQHGNASAYYPEGADDMGWLGYFVGKHEFLDGLFISSLTLTSGASVRDVLEPFLRGVSSNKSIREMGFYIMDLLGGEMFTMLGPFFKNNSNLTTIVINSCVWGDEGARLFALALGSSTNKSLRSVTLCNVNISEEGMADIITALSMYPHLKRLHFERNHLRTNGCVALATLLRCSATKLQYLNISNNEIDDEGIEALVPALTNCSCLEDLHLLSNPSITTRGWQSLATIWKHTAQTCDPSISLTMKSMMRGLRL